MFLWYLHWLWEECMWKHYSISRVSSRTVSFVCLWCTKCSLMFKSDSLCWQHAWQRHCKRVNTDLLLLVRSVVLPHDISNLKNATLIREEKYAFDRDKYYLDSWVSSGPIRKITCTNRVNVNNNKYYYITNVFLHLLSLIKFFCKKWPIDRDFWR